MRWASEELLPWVPVGTVKQLALVGTQASGLQAVLPTFIRGLVEVKGLVINTRGGHYYCSRDLVPHPLKPNQSLLLRGHGIKEALLLEAAPTLAPHASLNVTPWTLLLPTLAESLSTPRPSCHPGVTPT